MTPSRRARSPSSAASSSRRSSGSSGRARGRSHGGPMADTEHGRITDEGIAKLRARIGQGFPGRRPWRTEVTRDAIYHLALAIGDLNPLYLDDEYAAKTRWGTMIAPPIIVQSMDTLRAVGHSGLPEGLPGVHSIWTGSLYEWERTVKLGDPLGRIIKGPLTPTAEIAFESFFGIYLVGNVVAARLYDKHPALMIPNEQGVPEPPQRVHWDNAFTQRLLGLPGAYDLGPERCAWLCHLVTDWIGDDGLLTSIDVRYRRFNFMGDVTWCRGKVTDKLERDGKAYVRCTLECVN